MVGDVLEGGAGGVDAVGECGDVAAELVDEGLGLVAGAVPVPLVTGSDVAGPEGPADGPGACGVVHAVRVSAIPTRQETVRRRDRHLDPERW